MPEVVTQDLCRSMPFNLTRATDDSNSDGLTLEGYGAVFNAVTRIDSWEGTFDETIAAGAFRKSLNERTPRLQFDHGSHPLIGSIPIGKITEVNEDTQGLHVVARLSDNWLVEPVRDAIRDGSVDGMSFRFSVVRDEWVDEQGKKIKPEELADILWYGNSERGIPTRTLKEVKISEVGPVVWPAYEQTSVGVRSKVTIDLANLRDPAQRATLARAVMLADAATRSDDEANQTTETEEVDAPPATEESADEHATETPAEEDGSQEDTPQTTEPASAGEHESGETSQDPEAQPEVSQEDTDQQARSAINAALLEIRDSLALTTHR